MRKNKKKNFIPQAFKLDSKLVEKLNRYSATTGVSKTFVVERALEAYLDKKVSNDKPQ